MLNMKSLAIIAISAIAIGVLPIQLDLSSGGIGITQAQAKNGGGNGNGNGGGNRGGGGNGKGSSNSHGKSGSRSSPEQSSKGALFDKGLIGALFGKEKAASKNFDKKSTRSVKASSKSMARQKIASVKEKNLHAKLGPLNSLKRNVNAYLNSKSPKFAAVQAFVMASAQYELSLEAVDKAKMAVAQAQDQLDTLNAELDTLKALTAEEIAAMTPDEQATLTEHIAQLETEISTQGAVVTDDEAAVAEAQSAADQAAVGTDDMALKAALLEMTNKTPKDGTLDPDVVGWAKNVLGVGDAVGKIDEVREALKPGSSI